MIESKFFNLILAAALVVAIVLTGVLLVQPEDSPLAAASADNVLYASLFDPEKMMTVDIKVDETVWQGMLDKATAEMFIAVDLTINGSTFPSVAIRPKGNSSLSMVAATESDRFSFKIDFDQYVQGQTCFGLDKMTLNNIHADTTYMKDFMSYKMMAEMGVPSPMFAFASITVNGKPWGLYLAVEAIDASFAKRYFGSDYGQLYNAKSMDSGSILTATDIPGAEIPAVTPAVKPRAGFSLGAGTGCDLAYVGDDPKKYIGILGNAIFYPKYKDYQAVILALKHLSEKTEIEKYFDVDEILRYLAVHVTTVNLDSYNANLQQNYFVYEGKGQISILPWDYNMSFGCFESKTASSVVNFPIDTPVSQTSMESRPLIANLLADEKYMAQYHAYLQELVDKFFTSGKFAATVDQVDSLINEAVKIDPTAFFTYDEYMIAKEQFKLLGDLRGKSIQGQLNGTIPSTSADQKARPEALLDSSAIDLSSLGIQFMQLMAGRH